MAHYIDKDPLVAEIKRRMKNLTHEMSKFYYASNYNEWKFALNEYKSLMSFINTLDAANVDLEKEIQDHIKECLDVKFPTTDIELIKKDVAYTARKFYTLGLKAKQVKQEE